MPVDAKGRDWRAVPITLNQERQLLREEAADLLGIATRPLHTALALEMDELDVPALERALQLVVQRQGALRVSFTGSGTMRRAEPIERLLKDGVIEPGLYQQRLHATAALPLEIRRLRPGDGPGVVASIARETLLRRFDREIPPLARAVLVARDGQPFLLLVVVHHLISDDESLRLLHRDLEASYAYVIHGDEPGWSPTPLPYEHALARLRAGYEGDTQGALAHWTRQWRDYEPHQFHSRDFQREPAIGETTRVSDQPGRLDRSGVLKVRALARASRLTPTMVYLAAFAIVLAKCTTRDSFGVWSNVDNRWRTDTDGVMAWLVHSHLLGITVDPSAPGRQLLAQVRQVVMQAIAHGHVPLAELWRRTGRSLDWGFRVRFSAATEEPAGQGRPAPVMRRVGIPGRTCRADGLEFAVTEREGLASFKVRYSDTCLRPAVDDILRSYLTTLERLAADPGAAVLTM